jgi:transketolase
MEDILHALDKSRRIKYKPQVVIAHTVKGKGVSYMEKKVQWHSAKITPELAKQALAELAEKFTNSD